MNLVLVWDRGIGVMLPLCVEEGASVVVAEASMSLFSLPNSGCDEKELLVVGQS